MSDIKVYGADWCGDTRAALRFLDEMGVPYDYINVERDPRAREWLKRVNHGKEKKPTLDIAGKVVTNPSLDELEQLVAERKSA